MFSQCNCGSTGGCEKCRPRDCIITRGEPEYKPSPRFDPKKFYKPIRGGGNATRENNISGVTKVDSQPKFSVSSYPPMPIPNCSDGRYRE